MKCDEGVDDNERSDIVINILINISYDINYHR